MPEMREIGRAEKPYATTHLPLHVACAWPSIHNVNPLTAVDCTAGALRGALPGHWSERELNESNAKESRTFACVPAAACRGGLNSSCATGHQTSVHH